MKKITSLALAILLIVALALPASAALIGTYIDSRSGNQLTLPSTWSYSSQSTERTHIKFNSNTSDSAYMVYKSFDLYAGLDASARSKCSRSQVNNDLFTKAEIAEVLEIDSRTISMVTLGGNQYFYADTVYKSSSGATIDNDYWVMIKDGWFYIYDYAGKTSGQLYNDFKSVIASATYGTKTSGTLTQETKYTEAVRNYNNGNFTTAKSQFTALGSYKNSQDYLRLIRIRGYGENRGIGSVYDYRKALTDAEKADIDAAAKNFYFADTAEVLMCNSDVAVYYLYGNWSTASNASQYAYLNWYKDSCGGYYTRSTNLSNAVSDCVSINDGYVRVSITSSNTLVFHIKLTGPNSMSLYCYEYGKCVELFRQ